MRFHVRWILLLVASLALSATPPNAVTAATVANPICTNNTALYNPDSGQDIVVPSGYQVSVFAKDLNFPTAVAFRGNSRSFEVFVLESGHGLPSQCNDEESSVVGGVSSRTNPFTPDILVFDQNGKLIRGPLAKPSSGTDSLQPHGPAIGLAFEKGLQGGRLFATDSNQAIRAVGAQNNSSRIVTVDPTSGKVTPFITGLPTGDHPAEQITFKGEWIYWSQGSTTNSGVVGNDNGGGANQQDIPCQNITLSDNVFFSSPTVATSGYSPHSVRRPGAHIPAFDSATGAGICDGAILRARLDARNSKATIEPFSWGYRNPFGIRFAPDDHPLKGGLLVTENGEDERGARPTNNAPDRLQLAQQNPDGSPDYHGWPDHFGFLESTQAVFNPIGGPGDDLCNSLTPGNLAFPACIPRVTAQNPPGAVPVKPVLAFPPQPVTAPLALEPADVAAVGLDFVPNSFVAGPVRRGAALIGREGDFGFSAANGQPEAGHDVELVNFGGGNGEPLQIQQTRFAYNKTFEQAFVSGLRGINRPVDLKFGPDSCAYLVDYGAVRDFGRSDPDAKFVGDGNGPLVQIPRTGTIWKICKIGGGNRGDTDD